MTRATTIYFLTIVLFLVACKKIQPEMTSFNEGCDCSKEVSADFLMEEQSSNNPNIGIVYTDTDTTFAGKPVRFTAKEKNADYTWYIGAEVLTDEQYSRFFSTALAGSDIPISLVVRKKPNKICFPNDDGFDSITKYLHIGPVYDASSGYHPLEGTYRFFAPHLNDSIDVTLSIYYPLGMSNMFDLVNFDGLGNGSIFNSFTGKINFNQVSNLFVGSTVYGGYRLNIHRRIDGIVQFGMDGNGPNTNDFNYFGRKL